MSYTKLPDNARVWVYQSNRELTEQEVTNILAVGEFFLNGWESHGNKLQGAVEVFENRFVAVFGYDSDDNMCGRAGDAAIRFAKQLDEELQVGLMDRMQVAFIANGNIEVANINDFRQMLERGEANSDTPVYNNLVQTKGEFESNWKTSVANSWHKQLIVQ